MHEPLRVCEGDELEDEMRVTGRHHGGLTPYSHLLHFAPIGENGSVIETVVHFVKVRDPLTKAIPNF